MKMLFLSSDSSRVEQVSRAFIAAGIACEIRKGAVTTSSFQQAAQAELWIKEDADCHKALMLCVRLGFSRSASVAA